MNRRRFLKQSAWLILGGSSGILAGCRTGPQAQVMTNQSNMVGTTAAGSETFQPLIEEAVSKLLARQGPTIIQSGVQSPQPAKRICFVGLENKSAEELGDFKHQICQIIDTKINQSGAFVQISQRFVEAGLRQVRLRPDELFIPANQRSFLGVMEQQGQPFDYLLFANLTSGTTRANGDYQRDYVLTLELVNIQTGQPDKESAMIRKGYYGNRVGKWMHK